MAFVSSRTGNDALYVISPAGGKASLITSEWVLDPKWSP